jgi:hypothetical protein
VELLEKEPSEYTVGKWNISESFSDCGQLQSVVVKYNDLMLLNKETVEGFCNNSEYVV